MKSYIPKPKRDRFWPRYVGFLATHFSNNNRTTHAICVVDRMNAMLPIVDFEPQCIDMADLPYWLEEISSDEGFMLVANQAYRTLNTIGFWDWVESENVKLCGEDERYDSTPRVVCEDTPTIICCCFDSQPAITIVDCENWGWKIDEMADADAPTNFAALGILSRMRFAAYKFEAILEKACLGHEWRATAASQAWHGFRLNWMKHEIERIDGSPDEPIIQQAMYGGRNECYYLGEVTEAKKIFQYDANQLYSAAASKCLVPVRLIGPATHYDIEKNALFCVADVTIEPKFALWPYRAKFECGDSATMHTIWPTGTFRTALAGPELEMAREFGIIRKVHAAYQYQCEPVLIGWAKSLWEIRKQFSEQSGMCKRIALSLYGKFGQQNRKWVKDDENDISPPNIQVGDWYTMGVDGPIRHRKLGQHILREVVDGFEPNSSPPIAAWITSLGRCMLNRWLVEALGHVFYCDTDSLWVDEIGATALHDAGHIGAELGQLRLVSTHSSATFYGLRHYLADGKLVRAGVPADAVVAQQGKSAIWCRWQSFGEAMGQREWPRNKVVPGSIKGVPAYKHGVVGRNGWVKPHHIACTERPGKATYCSQQR